jgi:hypothetical protein
MNEKAIGESMERKADEVMMICIIVFEKKKVRKYFRQQLPSSSCVGYDDENKIK